MRPGFKEGRRNPKKMAITFIRVTLSYELVGLGVRRE